MVIFENDFKNMRRDKNKKREEKERKGNLVARNGGDKFVVVPEAGSSPERIYQISGQSALPCQICRSRYGKGDTMKILSEGN